MNPVMNCCVLWKTISQRDLDSDTLIPGGAVNRSNRQEEIDKPRAWIKKHIMNQTPRNGRF